jgi:hypothetical protein
MQKFATVLSYLLFLRLISNMYAAYLRWRDTKVFIRWTRDDAGNAYLYEFVLVPTETQDLFSLHISQVDYASGTSHLAERTITGKEFLTLRSNLIEV